VNVYKGVVENNKDPQKMGRCQIRIIGLHTILKVKSVHEGVPTNELPWANPAWPITNSGVSGIGDWQVPRQGSYVLVFAEDNDLQRFIYFAVITGIPQELANPDIGFQDPDGTYPELLSEPDYSRLSSNRKIEDTIIPIKVKECVKNIPTSDGKFWDEPQEPYSAEYPYNKVIETEAFDYKNGHIIEMDDTPGKERVHIWHKVGTFLSVHWHGQMVQKVVSDSYKIIRKSKYSYIAGSRYSTTWGDSEELVNKSLDQVIMQSKTIRIGGNKDEKISGDFELFVGSESLNQLTVPEEDIQDKMKDKTFIFEPIEHDIVYYNNKEKRNIRPINIFNITNYEEQENKLDSIPVPEIGDGYWRITIKMDKTETINGNHKINITGVNLMPGYNKMIARGVIGHHGLSSAETMVAGNISGFMVCPLLMRPHVNKSSSVKCSV